MLWIQVRDDFRHSRGDAKEAVGFLGRELKGQFQAAAEKGWHLRWGGGSQRPLPRKDSVWERQPLRASGLSRSLEAEGIDSTTANSHQHGVLLSGPFCTRERV